MYVSHSNNLSRRWWSPLKITPAFIFILQRYFLRQIDLIYPNKYSRSHGRGFHEEKQEESVKR